MLAAQYTERARNKPTTNDIDIQPLALITEHIQVFPV